jgi:hypothetical protein
MFDKVTYATENCFTRFPIIQSLRSDADQGRKFNQRKAPDSPRVAQNPTHLRGVFNNYRAHSNPTRPMRTHREESFSLAPLAGASFNGAFM